MDAPAKRASLLRTLSLQGELTGGRLLGRDGLVRTIQANVGRCGLFVEDLGYAGGQSCGADVPDWFEFLSGVGTTTCTKMSVLIDGFSCVSVCHPRNTGRYSWLKTEGMTILIILAGTTGCCNVGTSHCKKKKSSSISTFSGHAMLRYKQIQDLSPSLGD
uniref:(northern house mosquito) hypothetical protein n=1 Tax=Culex pipiens TaxID=7175 RepID=A0A8D8NBD4_CULPI